MPIVHTNGIDMYYDERGRGVPLILIMGLGADNSLWHDHVQEYAKHFRCLLIDNRGAGRSDMPEGPYTTRQMADDVAGLLRALKVDRAHVAGISMGGAIAQELTVNYPCLVRSLTLISTWDVCDPYTAKVFDSFKSLIITSDPISFNRLLQLWIFSPDWHKLRPEDLLRREQSVRENSNPMPIHAFQAQCDACMAHNTRGRLEKIQIPTLVTVGDQDIFTPITYAHSIVSQISDADLFVMKNAGHAHHWEQLDLFNHQTLDFLLKHNAY